MLALCWHQIKTQWHFVFSANSCYRITNISWHSVTQANATKLLRKKNIRAAYRSISACFRYRSSIHVALTERRQFQGDINPPPGEAVRGSSADGSSPWSWVKFTCVSRAGLFVVSTDGSRQMEALGGQLMPLGKQELKVCGWKVGTFLLRQLVPKNWDKPFSTRLNWCKEAIEALFKFSNT